MSLTMQHAVLAEIVQRDPRYAYEAYEFIFEALSHTQEMLERRPAAGPEGGEEPAHVTGRELLDGIRDLALREFGLMARTVFRLWGIERTNDFGEIVYNLIEAKQMCPGEGDARADFQDVFNLDEALVHEFHIQLDPAE